MKKKRFLMMMLTTAVLLLTASCSKDNDEPQPVNPPTAAGARLQVMLVFAPGQLGDQSYADGILTASSALEYTNEHLQGTTDSIDVQFISLYSTNDTRKALKQWAATTSNPFYEGTYERRLLVLTEPFMTAWLSDVQSGLRPTDEVLLMKVDEAYVEKTATVYGFGERVHGLNIDLSPFIRKYCNYISSSIDSAEDPATFGEKPQVVFFRRFNAQQNTYCDGIEDIIRQELGNKVSLTVTALSDYAGNDGLSEETSMSFIQAAYQASVEFEQHFANTGYGFVLTDLGTCSSGMDYYLVGRRAWNYEVLMIDGNLENNSRLAISRNPLAPFVDWTRSWMHQDAGAMPRFRQYDSSNVRYNMGDLWN